jgi:hypothetical protein
MNVALFQKIAEKLLQTHYSINLSDTSLYEELVVSGCISQGEKPYQVVNCHAREADLDRTAHPGFYGVLSKAELTQRDEDAAIAALSLASAGINTSGPIQLTEDEFFERFRPIVNHLQREASWSGCMFETHGLEQEYVHSIRDTEPARVWTILEVDGAIVVASGYSRVNRTGYLITEVPVDGGISYEVSDELLNDPYAESVIGDDPGRFDALEIQGLREIDAPNDFPGTCYESDNENPQSYTVYVHSKTGEAHSVGDFGDHALALLYAGELAAQYKWPIHDFTKKADASAP